jgi:sulfane dehydrogenase subunit SoxC
MSERSRTHQDALRFEMSRREFLRLLRLGGSAALLAACGASSTSPTALPNPTAIGSGASSASTQMFAKPEESLIKVFATELGTRWDQSKEFLTPVGQFYVRNRYPSPIVDPKTWRLKVQGDAIERPLELTYDELTKLPTRKAARYMECFGNGRTLNWEQLGHDVKGGNWGFSAISMGEWEYVPIGEILDRVKPKPEAAQLLFWSGVDGRDTGRPMPMEEILARPDVIGLAFTLNGQPLAPDHGGPVRALVPGWGGAASIKWLTEIRISTLRFWTRMHTKEESLIGPEYPAEKPAPTDEFLGVTASDVRGTGATWQNVKSFLTLPLVLRKSEPPGRYPLKPGELPTLPAGQQTMKGYASSPWGIEKVEFSLDGGTWQAAALIPPGGEEYTWVRFEFPWDARPGTHILMTRATDKKGTIQPEKLPFNELGILCNAIPKFEVQVR